MDTLRSESRDAAVVALDLQRLQHEETDERNAVMCEVMTLCRPTIRKIAVHLKLQEADILNLEQIVFTQIFQKIHTLQDPSRLIPWTKTITRNTAINNVRKEVKLGRHSENEILQETIEDSIREPWEFLALSEVRDIIRRSMSDLKEVDIEILQLAQFEEKTMQEIAVILSKPVGTIKRRLHTARRRIREILRPSIRASAD